MEAIEQNQYIDQKLLSTISFSLSGYDHDMTAMQLKLQGIGIAQIDVNDNAFDDKMYEIRLDLLSEIMGINERTLVRNMHAAGDKLFKMNPVFVYKNEQEDIVDRIAVFDRIITDRKKKITYIGYTRWFREAVIKAKRIYDISMPVNTLANFTCKYSLLLYPFLLAQAAIQRKEGIGKNYKYDIMVSKEKLQDIMRYTGTTSNFHARALYPACKDLNEHSEIYIKGETPQILFKEDGKTTKDYVFHITIKTALNSPMFSSNENMPPAKDDLPSRTYIADKLRDLGVIESFIKHILSPGKSIRMVWSNYIYTILQGEKASPRYFNSACEKNWAYSKDLETMFRKAIMDVPGFLDDTTAAILKHYDDFREKPEELVLEPMDSWEKKEIESNIPIKERLSSLKQSLKSRK